jgi:general secretion pathway protein D
MDVGKQMSDGSGWKSRPRFSSKEESQMKWCMVAAMTVSLLFGSVAWAQEDGFDLDALLGDFDSAPEQVEESEPAAAEEAALEAADEDWAVDSTVAEAAEEIDALAAEAVEEIDELSLETAEEIDAVAADAAMEIDAVAADAMDDFGMDEEMPAAAPADDLMADDDLLGDLFAPAEPSAPAMDDADAFAPAADEPMADDFQDDFMDEDLSMEGDLSMEEDSFAPAAATRSAAPAEKLSTRELKKIARETAQQEEIRRQAAEVEALKASETGFRALSDGNYIAAENAFSSALSNLPDRPQNEAVREQISWGMAEAQYLRARAMVQRQERLEEARKLVDSAIKIVPTHRGAQALSRRLARLEAERDRPKAPFEQPATLDKAKTISQMYDEARQWYMIKDFDRATAMFEQILLRDPYHKSTLRYLRKIESDKYTLATYEREARVQGMMTDVRRAWSPPIRAQIETPADLEAGTGRDSRPDSERLHEKMQKIIIPEVQFRQANINDVVNFLVEASIAADPEKEGVNIILNLGQSGGGGGAAPAPAAAPAVDEWGFAADDFDAPMPSGGGGGASGVRDITLNLRRISMLDAIKYITEVANLKFRVESTAVMITSIDAPIGNIITRMYPVQPSFMDVIVERADSSAERDSEFVSMGSRVSVTRSDVKDFFEKTGVKFPAGASVTYNATISQLIVANTADNLETFERILQKINVVPNQVEIEARFIEVDQTDLEELGLQWILNDNYEFASKNDGSGQRLQVNANNNGLTQGNRFFNYNPDNFRTSPASAITRGISQTPLGGILSASSVLTNPEVTIVLQALSQHGGTDLLSAPRVTTRSGVNAQIQVVKEIIYPTEFDLTQPTVDTDGNVTMAPIVTPGTFETRETGVILNVTPTVGPDGYTIDLVMAPEVAELVDWIQYGSTITISGSDVYFFNMPQPVFTSRNVTTSIVIWDGQTVVMGGLIREELTTIRDKVPILGDIPLLGWLFRSEGQHSSKKNLLIFVTARLVDPAGRPIHREGALAMPGTGLESDAELPL